MRKRMYMFEEYTRIALAVDACKGGVDGRKKIQKMIHIAKALGYPFREDFTLYLYGPYSEELAAEIQRMKELDLLRERELDSSYIITLTENGKTFLKYFQDNVARESGNEKFEKMRNLFKELSIYTLWELEIIATLFYFYQTGYNNLDQLQDVVRGVKPKFSSQDIRTMGDKFLAFIEEYAEQ
ncbi:MAG: hypothetical protein HXS54_10885 [Theionarchaea archaeon]|nr:hypothetical protein [Theionarchaea archaeon]